MIDKKQIDKWLKDGTITAEQATKMLEETTETSKEEKSNKMIVALSVIGSVFLGAGAILFIASNWEELSDTFKIILLLGGTFGSFYLGYFLKYQKANLPRVGGSIIFLSTLLFGASIFLIAQIYNINANSHLLLLLWLLGVLPIVYFFASPPAAALSAVIFFVWVWFFVIKGNLAQMVEGGGYKFIPIFYLIFSLFLFAFGAVHYLFKKYGGVARTFRLAGLEVALASLFLLTFKVFSGMPDDYYYLYSRHENFVFGEKILAILFISVGLAAALYLISIFLKIPKNKTYLWENLAGLGLLILSVIFFFVKENNNIYSIAFSLIFAALLILILYIGYQNEDAKVVNMALFWISIFIIARYFDFFWKLLPRSVFFMIGGAILIGGGLIMEKQRRRLKKQFNKK